MLWPKAAVKSSSGMLAEEGSRESYPAMTFIIRAASLVVRVMGPTVSRLNDNGKTPRLLTRPNVGFNPTMPHSPAGILTEPPVSLPSAPMTWPDPTADPAPPLEPPVMLSTSHGLCAGPS